MNTPPSSVSSPNPSTELSPQPSPVASKPITDQSENKKNDDGGREAFLKKARSFQTPRTTKISILTPYRDRIMFAYDNGIKLPNILKTLESEGIKTSYDNLRAYINRQKNSPSLRK